MNTGNSNSIWFWQKSVSPHMLELAESLVASGSQVTLVAETMLTPDRVAQGWSLPALAGVRLELVGSRKEVHALVTGVPTGSNHFCSGMRNNSLVGVAQKLLAKRHLDQWVVMETVDDTGWKGFLKRRIYSSLFKRKLTNIKGVLSIGHRTSGWLQKLGVPSEKLFPFAYFLPVPKASVQQTYKENERFRFLFVGQLIERKRLDSLIEALGELLPANFELAVVGFGPSEQQLKSLARRHLGDRLDWIGKMSMDQVATEMVNADCLVLPSRHDGWGAVVSEALMVGTPAICSDTCGAAGVARASGYGGVFSFGDRESMLATLERVLKAGRPSISERSRIEQWAQCLNGDAGARYLIDIINYQSGSSERPLPPWKNDRLA